VFFKRLVKNNEPLDRIAKLFLASRFFGLMYFAAPIWYAFATEAITPAQVGIFFSALGIVQFIAEVPTGVIADKYSRKLSALIGTFILLFVPLVVYFGHNFTAYMVAALLCGVGRAFVSGSLDSLVYDHKNVSKEAYRRISGLEVTLTSAGLILSVGAGGLLFSLHKSLPFIAEAVAGVVCLVLIWLMREDMVKTCHVAPSSHTRHFWEGVKLLLATKYLRIFILMSVPIWVMLRICIQFVNEAALIEHGFEPSFRGLFSAFMTLLTLVCVQFFLFKVLKRDRERILFISIASVVAFALLGLGGLVMFLIGFLLWNWLLGTHSAFIKPILQDNLPSTHRSTAMSGFAALTSLVGFGGSALIGWLVDLTRTPRSAYIFFAVVSSLAVLPAALWLAAHLKRNPERAIR
jgi:MFS family permease